jgi:hypothetical protein
MSKVHEAASFTCHITVKQPLLSVKVSGHALAVDMLNSYYEAIEIAKMEGAEKILIDMRELYMGYESFDMLNVMTILEKKLTPFKVARLVNNQFRKNAFLQEIASNKNILLRNFRNEDEANLWLFG